jgi:hypothetical protein
VDRDWANGCVGEARELAGMRMLECSLCSRLIRSRAGKVQVQEMGTVLEAERWLLYADLEMFVGISLCSRGKLMPGLDPSALSHMLWLTSCQPRSFHVDAASQDSPANVQKG